MASPDFLELPRRDVKPRVRGLTFAIDGGLLLDETRAILAGHGAWIDGWKLGWGSAYIDAAVTDKTALLRDHRVLACPGGTLLEIAALQARAEDCLEWAIASGFSCIEVSVGLGLMEPRTKAALIRRAARDAVVVAEIGAKDPTQVASPDAWADAALDDLAAGASWVIAEGRESGSVGIYEADGTVREAIVDRLLERVGPDQLVFEAPRKDQQAWFVRRVGPDVNLANVAPRDVLGVEALRLGLRADTTLAIHAAAVARM